MTRMMVRPLAVFASHSAPQLMVRCSLKHIITVEPHLPGHLQARTRSTVSFIALYFNKHIANAHAVHSVSLTVLSSGAVMSTVCVRWQARATCPRLHRPLRSRPRACRRARVQSLQHPRLQPGPAAARLQRMPGSSGPRRPCAGHGRSRRPCARPRMRHPPPQPHRHAWQRATRGCPRRPRMRRPEARPPQARCGRTRRPCCPQPSPLWPARRAHGRRRPCRQQRPPRSQQACQGRRRTRRMRFYERRPLPSPHGCRRHQRMQPRMRRESARPRSLDRV